MIFVKLEENMFFNEIRDIVKLFYQNMDIIELKDGSPEENRGVVLSGRFMDKDGKRFYKIELLDGSRVFYSEDILITSELKTVDDYEIRKTLKNEIKRHAYLALADYRKINPPWGILTIHGPGG